MSGPGKRPLAYKFEVWLAALDPVVGSEIAKTRPVVIISPDEYNRHLNTVLAAPLTSSQKRYLSRIPIKFQNKSGEVALDQIRSIDRLRLIKYLGTVDSETAASIQQTLLAYFA